MLLLSSFFFHAESLDTRVDHSDDLQRVEGSFSFWERTANAAALVRRQNKFCFLGKVHLGLLIFLPDETLLCKLYRFDYLLLVSGIQHCTRHLQVTTKELQKQQSSEGLKLGDVRLASLKVLSAPVSHCCYCNCLPAQRNDAFQHFEDDRVPFHRRSFKASKKD